MQDGKRQIRIMIALSLLAHVFILGGWLCWYTVRSQATPDSRVMEAPIVDLYDISELPEALQVAPEPEIRKIAEEQAEEQIVALEHPPTVPSAPTATPTLTPTPTPFPTVNPQTIPQPTPTPRPRLNPTATPQSRFVSRPTATSTPQQAKQALDIPRRPGVISPQQDPDSVQRVVEREQVTPTNSGNTRQQAIVFSDRLSRETPLFFEMETDFPYPEYLAHIKEKIEGLWFPEGKGTVLIYLIIDKNGKILKSGVDKGTGLEVNKLRESVVRAMTLIQRFKPLPSDYTGSTLRIQITVRR